MSKKPKKPNPDSRRALGRTRPSAIIPVPPSSVDMPDDYASLLADLKKRITTERLKVTLAANAAMVLLYWDMGQAILRRQEREGWGAKVIDRLSADLRVAFPDMSGLSARNLKYMRAFAAAWPDRAIVQAPLAQITWYHNIALLEKLQSAEDRLWYAAKTVEYGWSHDILTLQIQGQLHQRQGKALTNFSAALPPADCRGKDRPVAEYALRNFGTPIGVADWESQLVSALPQELKGSLPTVEEIEAELQRLETPPPPAPKLKKSRKKKGGGT